MAIVNVLWSAAIAAGAALASAVVASFATYKVTNRSISAQERLDRQGRLFEHRAETYLTANQFLLGLNTWLARVTGAARGDDEFMRSTKFPEPSLDKDFEEMMGRCRTFAEADIGERLVSIHSALVLLNLQCTDRSVFPPRLRQFEGDELKSVQLQVRDLQQQMIDFGAATRSSLIGPMPPE